MEKHKLTVRVQPISGAEPLMCPVNVQKRIKAKGGKPVFGWEVKIDREVIEIHTAHCIWESPGG
jgi:hypothetical protein